MQLPISEEGYKEIERAREVLSSASGKALSMEETLIELARFYLKRKDPVERAERAKVREAKLQQIDETVPAPGEKPAAKINDSARRPLRAKTVHAVTLRDGGQCRAKLPDGQACGERRWLEFHHLRPIAMGGTDELDNLITLCRAHHQSVHSTDSKHTHH
jgi:curved DNA-binding protein CbpA